jgi:hypothetical protein
VGDVEFHLLQGFDAEDVEPASTVDEDLVELGARNHWLQDEREPSWFGEASPLIRAEEGNGYLRPPERGRNRWFDAHDFSMGSLLLPPGGYSAEEEVDSLVGFLEVVVFFVVLLLAFLVMRVRWLWSTLECMTELVALLGGVVAVQMPQALLLQQVFEAARVPLRVLLRRALDSRDSVVWLALAVGTRVVVVVVATALVPVVAVAAARILLAFATDGVVLGIGFVFFICPGRDHVLEVGDGLGAATTEVFKGAAMVEAILEEVNDLVGDVDYDSALVEEAAHVLAEGLALFLLDPSGPWPPRSCW